MARRVVCISRLVGAGGEVVGQAVADALGFQLVDEEILQRAADSSGVSVEELADAEHRTKFIDGLIRNITIAGGASSVMALGAGGPIELGGGPDPKSLRAMIQTSIHETAERGDVVIVSHGASHALPDSVGVLRVLVTASPETRATRVAQADSIDVKKASKAVADSDVRRAQYLRRFYGVVEERPTHYDLVLNSDTLSFELMSDLVVRAARALSASLVPVRRRLAAPVRSLLHRRCLQGRVVAGRIEGMSDAVRTLPVRGVEIAVRQVGRGSDLVLVHGFQNDHTAWDPYIERLDLDSYRVTAFDLVGCGASASVDDWERCTIAEYAEDLVAVCDALEIAAPVVVGHSLGGATAWRRR